MDADRMKPNDVAIERVMRETGMGYLQAYHHVQGSMWLKEREEPQRPPYPEYLKNFIKETT
jgi:hypothetical protein